MIALAADGEAVTDLVAADGSFSLAAPAESVSLHLRAPDGTYAGPIVLEESWNVIKRAKKKLRQARKNLKRAKSKLKKAEGKAAKRKAKRKVKKARKKLKQAKKALAQARNRASGKRAILRLQAGAKLGSVTVRPAAGYAKAKLTERQWNSWVVEKTQARAKDGVPIGAGNFGFVKSKETKGGAPGDLDLDGVADPLDIDDNGNLIIDRYEHGGDSSAASSHGPIASTSDLSYLVPTPSSALTLTLKETVNANATGLTIADINDTLARRGFLLLNTPLNLAGQDVTAELDCGGSPDPGGPNGWSGGLSYCAKGGTGRWSPEFIPFSPPRSWPLVFPDCCDSDGDGFGEPPRTAMGAPFFSHGATTDEIGTGDVLNWRVAEEGGVEAEFPTTVSDVIATVPALVSWKDGAGNSGTVNYPVPPPYSGSPPPFTGGDEGPYEGFEVGPCPAGAPAPCVEGDFVLTFTFWRPQREAIPGVEQGQWTDIGGLAYSASFGPINVCREQSNFSTDDPNLTAEPGSGLNGSAGFRDSAADRPADPANILSFSLNLSKCLGISDPTGYPRDWPQVIWLSASPGVGGGIFDFGSAAAQELYFILP